MAPATIKSTTTYTSTSYSTFTVYATGTEPNPYTSFSSADTYTIPASTVVVTETVVVPCPTSASADTYAPGTYTHPETTLTVTDTETVFSCPYVTVSPVPLPPSDTPVPASAPTPEHTGEAQPPPPAPSSDTTPSGGSAPISATGKQWAMTYSPYLAGGGCKDAGAVSTDIAAIKAAGFGAVRLYSTDCAGLENVGNSCKEHGMSLILGIFIDKEGIAKAQPQVDDMIEWGQWGSVELVVVGNEALFNGFCDVNTLAQFIDEVKGRLRGSGYKGPVTTTETLNIWQQHGSALCDHIDVIGANVHPFFNSDISPENAGAFTVRQIELVGQICPGKEVYNLESGWPHSGEDNGKATPGYDHQITAIKSIIENVGAKTVFFSFEDDMWKKPGEFGVEQSWGCTKVFSS